MAEKKIGNRRKTVDKWKKKKWFAVLASKTFNRKPLGETPAEKPVNLEGRTMRVTLDVVTGQRTRRDTAVTFKYTDIQGQTVNTRVSSFQLSKGTLGRLISRRNSKVGLLNKISVEGGEARINIFVVTMRKATQKQRTSIRKIIEEEVAGFKGKDFEFIVKELLMGKFVTDIYKRAGKICMIKKVVVAKASFTEAK